MRVLLVETASFPFLPTTKLEATTLTLTHTLQVPFRAFRQDPEVAVSQFWGRRKRTIFFLFVSRFTTSFSTLIFFLLFLYLLLKEEEVQSMFQNCVLACK
ncbi:unnamed protein product [Vicia faba]|uniref:Uncharacterized protein n=1 Tax=Vicia faba TaxID=3906 RepID=A0AAV1AQC5_VICFA|nr:unnamed protein product [Vicia faba]